MRRNRGAVFATLTAAVGLTVGLVGSAGSADAARGAHGQRVCPAATADGVTCFALKLVDATGHDVAAPDAAAPPAGAKSPADIRSAYRLGSASSGGRTVAIVDAYGYPNAERDLATYRSRYGLSACTSASGCLRVVNQTGGSSLPQFNLGWAQEQALDLDAVSATCPDCRILLVQASSSSIANLGTAVDTAAKLGATAISNSYGGGDLSDSTYGHYYDHAGIAVTASTGDNGYQGGSFPASSRFVTAVGGTSLSRAGNSRGWTESAWSGAGSGCSDVNQALAAAASAGTGCARRAIADVSAVADPQTGLAVYAPGNRSSSSWAQYGGTSLSSPIIASVYAMSGNTTGYANATPYSHTGSLFDVSSGSNGSCPTTQWCRARSGWDGPTGLGTPNGVGAF